MYRWHIWRLNSIDAQVRNHAVDALRREQSPRVVWALLRFGAKMARAYNNSTWSSVIAVLGHMKHITIAPLLNALADPSADMRCTATAALCERAQHRRPDDMDTVVVPLIATLGD